MLSLLPHLWVQLVWQALKEDAGGAYFFGACVVAMRQVPTTWQLQAHDAVMRLQQGGVGCKVCRTAGSKNRKDLQESHFDQAQTGITNHWTPGNATTGRRAEKVQQQIKKILELCQLGAGWHSKEEYSLGRAAALCHLGPTSASSTASPIPRSLVPWLPVIQLPQEKAARGLQTGDFICYPQV